MGDNSKVDLIALYQNKAIKIQVKSYTSEDDGSKVTVYATKSGPNYSFKYTEEQIDIFAVYVLDTNEVLYISSRELCSQNKTLSIRLKEAKNGQKMNIRKSDEYKDFYVSLKKQNIDW